MLRSKVLIISTSAARMTSGDQTGVWLEELAAPYYAFSDAGADVTVASVSGGAIPVDSRSVSSKGQNPPSVERYLDDNDLRAACMATPRFDSVDLTGFNAVFLPGGHGAMFDFPGNEALARVIEAFDRAGKVIAAVCHGPAGLLDACKSDGTPLVRGRRIAAFTDSEERAVGLDRAMPFLLESRLREIGANIEATADFQPIAVRDDQLITGQNPTSSHAVAKLVIDAMDTTEKAA